jgi:hypothetical protein
MRMAVLILAVVLCCGIFPRYAVAENAPAPVVKKKPVPDLGPINTPDLVEQAFYGDDNYQVQQAVDAAITMLMDEKSSTARDRLPIWFHILVNHRRFDEIEDIAVASINGRPYDLALVETCQIERIRGKLINKQPKEGLSLAKALYNACPMQDTSRAIDLIAECLYDMNVEGDPAGVVKKFKLQQLHGAATTRPATATDDNILDQISIDSKCYEPGLQQAELIEDSWRSLQGQGNLLLLAGRPKDAAKVFEKAYALASDKNLPAATEAVARAMRAQDSSVGRANTWILSLRPADDANAGQ